MKKLIITATLLASSLFASIDQVQTYYDAKQYKEAIAQAKASTEDYSNPQLHLLWAKSAEALGLDNEAMSAYERVEMLDENNIDARVALIKLYKRTGRDALAQEDAKALQNYQLTPKQRTTLDNLRGINVHSLKASANLSLGHDTNINVAADELEQTGATPAISTLFARFTGSVSYINELEEKGGWYGRADLQIYNQDNFATDTDDFDLFLGSLSAGAGYAGDGYNIYVPVGIDNVHYLSKNLLTQVKLKPNVNFTLSNELIVNAAVNYLSRVYNDDTLSSRDDTTYGLGAGVYYLLGKDYVFCKASYDSVSAKDSALAQGAFVDKALFGVNLGVNYNLASWLVMKADYKLRSSSFDDEGRSDTLHQANVKFSHYFADMFEAYLSESYMKNSSSITKYEYSKNILMFGIALNY